MLADRTLELVREGYPWASRVRASAPESAAVPVRLLGRRTAVVGGPAGVRRFYDPRLRRRGAFPLPVRLVLFGPGTVHGLDDREHHVRKALYLRVLTPAAVGQLAARAEREWADTVAGWQGREQVVLFDEAVRVLAASVLAWAQVPVAAGELPVRAAQLATVVDGFATPGQPYAEAVRARVQLGRWASDLVRRVRRGALHPEAGSALREAALARDAQGRRLPARVAGVELLNLLRPTVAVAWFVAFAGQALAEQPAWRERIAGGDREALLAFAHEVRRRYPFVPVLAARARRAQDVLGVRVPRGGLVVLDVHGTDHDPARWPHPDTFDPERFLHGPVDQDALVPQGGGDLATGHRCPGEDVVLVMLTVSVRALAGTAWSLPPQDLHADLRRMPTRPASGVVLRPEQVRRGAVA